MGGTGAMAIIEGVIFKLGCIQQAFEDDFMVWYAESKETSIATEMMMNKLA